MTPRVPSRRRGYLRRLLASAFDATLELFRTNPKRAFVTFLGTTLALSVLYNVTPEAERPGVLTNLWQLLLTIPALLLLAVAAFVVNLVLAPWRLDRDARQRISDLDHEVLSLKGQIAADAAKAEAATIAAAAAEADRSVTVRVTGEGGPLQSVDVSDTTIAAWISAQRQRLGEP